MSKFFINSSEIYVLSYLSSGNLSVNQQAIANSAGCTQPNISIVINNLIEKNLVSNIKGFYVVNQLEIIKQLTEYGEEVFYTTEFISGDRMLKIKNYTREVFGFFKCYFRMFNTPYVLVKSKKPFEVCFVFSQAIVDLSYIDTEKGEISIEGYEEYEDCISCMDFEDWVSP